MKGVCRVWPICRYKPSLPPALQGQGPIREGVGEDGCRSLGARQGGNWQGAPHPHSPLSLSRGVGSDSRGQTETPGPRVGTGKMPRPVWEGSLGVSQKEEPWEQPCQLGASLVPARRLWKS